MYIIASLDRVSFIGDRYCLAFIRVKFHFPGVFPFLKVVKVFLEEHCVCFVSYGTAYHTIIGKEAGG